VGETQRRQVGRERRRSGSAIAQQRIRLKFSTWTTQNSKRKWYALLYPICYGAMCRWKLKIASHSAGKPVYGQCALHILRVYLNQHMQSACESLETRFTPWRKKLLLLWRMIKTTVGELSDLRFRPGLDAVLSQVRSI